MQSPEPQSLRARRQQVLQQSVISQYRLSRGLLLFAAWWSIFSAGSGAGQLGSAIEKPATTNKNTAVDLPPLAVASIRQVAPADNDAMLIRFSDDGASSEVLLPRGSFSWRSPRSRAYLFNKMCYLHCAQ
jgi:hypothetical protein